MSDQEWDTTELGAVAQLEMGQAPSSQYVSERQEPGSWPFLQGNADFTATHPKARQWCSRPAKVARAGDSLISVRAPVGALNLADQDYCIGRGLAAVRFQRLHARFGHHQLVLKKSELHRVSQGSTFDAIGSKELRELQFLVPSDPEQRRIAEILDTLDDQIRATKQIVTKLNTVRLSILEELYQRLLTDASMTILDELTVCIVDGVHHTPIYTDSGIPFLTIENLTRGSGISLSPCRFVSEKAHSIYRKRIEPLAGDVLVSKDGTLGVARIVPRGFPTASVFVSVAVLRPRTKLLSPDFLRLFFDTNDFKRQLGGLSAGSGLKHIHLEHFRRFLLPMVDISEQLRVVLAINHCDDLIAREDLSLTKLLQIRQGLASDLLTGRVRVPSEAAS
jgi:type I restriction enzyme S subunit